MYHYNIREHSITQKAPLELMMGRPVKDKLPNKEISCKNQDEEMRDRDSLQKLKGKLYADKKRKAKDSSIEPGDEVLELNREKGKLEPTFKTNKFKVLRREGAEVIIENENGIEYRRNVAHLKKIPKKMSESDKCG